MNENERYVQQGGRRVVREVAIEDNNDATARNDTFGEQQGSEFLRKRAWMRASSGSSMSDTFVGRHKFTLVKAEASWDGMNECFVGGWCG